MKLTSVEFHPENSSNVIVLSYRDPASKNPYNVKAIVGLDADEIIAKFSGKSPMSNFYTLSMQKRDVIARINLNPSFSGGESYSDLRDNLYRIIASSRTGKVQIQFKNEEDVIAAVSGFVSKLETPHFEKTQEVQVTVSCDEPMLKALERTVLDVTGLDPGDTVIQDDSSTAPHGFVFILGISADMDSITLIDPSDDSWSFKITPVGGFLAGDYLVCSTEPNSKTIFLTRGTDVIYLGDVVEQGSSWPIIFPGDNRFSWSSGGSVFWASISHYLTYWGV